MEQGTKPRFDSLSGETKSLRLTESAKWQC